MNERPDTPDPRDDERDLVPEDGRDDVHDAPDDDLDEAGLWDPRVAGEELRSLRRRLAPHAHRERAWVLPASADGPGDGPPDEDEALLPSARPAGATTGDGSPEAEPSAGPDDDGWPWPLREEDDATPGDTAARARTTSEPADAPPPASRASTAPGSILQADTGWGVRLVSIVAAAALVVLAVGELMGWRGAGEGGAAGEPTAAYLVEALEGTPTVARGDELLRSERLDVRPGDRLVTDAVTRARLDVRSAGSVRLEPGTELHVDDTPAEGWRLFLARGQVTASIFAAPRLFQVGTPSGIAVDLGCVYTATVGDDGETLLTVRGGQVSFETARRKVHVPDGARVVAWPGRGPGTPVWEDAPAPVKKAVEALDALRDRPVEDLAALGLDGALAELETLDDPRQSLSLFHLLDHPNPQVSRRVLATLTRLCPPPPGVDPEAVVRGRPEHREAWKAALERLW